MGRVDIKTDRVYPVDYMFEQVKKLSDLLDINTNSIIPTYTNGQLTKVEEKNGETIRASTNISYNSDGTVNTITELINNQTVITTLHYVNGEFSSISKEVS